jgi:hypothetical protein
MTFELVNHFRSEIVESKVEPGNVFYGGHMLDDVREHLADFVERRLFCR